MTDGQGRQSQRRIEGLGVCYYPEQWPRDLWAEDARRMKALGLSFARIGEFAWSKIEPAPGHFDWEWLDVAIETLQAAGLNIVLGTPTATPPKWLIDLYPEILPWGADGAPRRFGSRRHYCFSSPIWRRETARIVDAVAARYGVHDAVVAWQTDNEYGCHDTVRSYSPAAAAEFRRWLAARYGDCARLNAAWGGSFWSQDYRTFDEIDPPNLTVTEPNPAHVLDFCRFSSDQVVSYNRLQTEILRRRSPGRDIIHNFMGFFTDFDHFALGRDIDVAGWDSYPLGFLDTGPYDAADKARYLQQGHPDFGGFHHDLYRRCGGGRFLVMEQQPGPVNWARHNPAPLPGMVRLWTHEAFAHGAEAVSYFRWRQAPFAQEQMHAGLLRPDNTPAPAYDEARRAAGEYAPTPALRRAKVGLIFCYEAKWMFEIAPQGASWDYFKLVLSWYGAARRLGFDVDILSPRDAFDGYDLVLAPSLPLLPDDFADRVAAAAARFVFGPRTGSKTRDFQIPGALPPGALQRLLPLKVARSESLPASHVRGGDGPWGPFSASIWLDHIETALTPRAGLADGAGVFFEHGPASYLAGVVDDAFLLQVIADAASRARLMPQDIGPDLRLARRGGATYAFNYALEAAEIPGSLIDWGDIDDAGRLASCGVARLLSGD